MTALLTAAAILIVAWFAAGTIWNVRKGSSLLRWMQGGLPAVGARTTVRWLGSTAVEMVLREPKPPFEKVTVVIFLEPRDMPWMWIFSRRTGRRDTLILRGELRNKPAIELELLDRTSWSGRDALRAAASAGWSVREGGRDGLTAFYKGDSSLARADALLGVAAESGLPLRRLSVRGAAPHLQLHVGAPGAGASAMALFASFRALGERAAH